MPRGILEDVLEDWALEGALEERSWLTQEAHEMKDGWTRPAEAKEMKEIKESWR